MGQASFHKWKPSGFAELVFCMLDDLLVAIVTRPTNGRNWDISNHTDKNNAYSGLKRLTRPSIYHTTEDRRWQKCDDAYCCGREHCYSSWGMSQPSSQDVAASMTQPSCCGQLASTATLGTGEDTTPPTTNSHCSAAWLSEQISFLYE